MRFCPGCGGPLQRQQPADDDRPRHVCAECATIHYQNPKVIVGSVCRSHGRILLCRRAIEPRAGYWTIPAGYLELGETVEAGARREAWEEARARIRLDGLIAVYSVTRIDQVQLLFRAALLDEGVEPGPESLEVDLFAPEAIPWQSLAFPTVGWVLERALALADDPGPIVPATNDGVQPPRLDDEPS